jgi:hypothetical protein
MKRLVISCILILALTNQGYAMGWLDGRSGGGGGSSAGTSSGGNTNTNTKSISNTTANSTTNFRNNITIGDNSGGTELQMENSTNIAVSTPGVTILCLLISALVGLRLLRRKLRI